MIAIEQQKTQFQAQVGSLATYNSSYTTKCLLGQVHGGEPEFKETCLVSCVDRFIDTTLSITNRFTQMVQKSSH
ncbi:unnamed protein product, partial [Coregonus sp. 'balchen']